MPIALESDGKVPSDRQLLLRGVVVLIVAALVVVVLVEKSSGKLNRRVAVTAELVDVGDGLPAKSDVKFRGILVGSVRSVAPAPDGRTTEVEVDLKPDYANSIPRSVTARVVPSNVFAVSTVQLVDNGPAPALPPDARIPQDRNGSTVQFQTTLTRLRGLVAAAGRTGNDDVVGMLATLAQATDRRGAALAESGSQLRAIVGELNRIVAPAGADSTLAQLAGAVSDLRSATPDLLEALHQSVVPLRTLAETQDRLHTFLGAGVHTLDTAGTALDNNTDRLIGITTSLTPVIGVLADNSASLLPISTRLRTVSEKFMSEFWNADRNVGTIMTIVSFTPHRLYGRDDCPRYGALAGPSCATAPVIQQQRPASNMHPAAYGGAVGSVGSAAEADQLRRITGETTTAATTLLLGPLARGNLVTVRSEAGGGR